MELIIFILTFRVIDDHVLTYYTQTLIVFSTLEISHMVCFKGENICKMSFIGTRNDFRNFQFIKRIRIKVENTMHTS